MRHVGAAGLGDGRRVHAVGPGRPPAHRTRGGRRVRAPARHAVLPRHRQPRLRPLRGGRCALRRVRARSRRPLGRRRPVGSRRAGAPSGSRALRPVDGRGRPAVPVPRGRRRGGARLPPGRHDARRQPAAGPHAGHPRLLDGGRPLAERLRRRGRHREDDRRVDDDRRDRARHERPPCVAVRRGVPGARPGRGRRPRGLQVLLPPPLPARHRRVGPAEPPLAAPRQAPGGRRGLRRQERLGARGPPRPGEALAALGSRPARVRLGAAAVVQERGRGARRDPRSRRPDRHDLVRQDRCPGPRRSAPARARRLQPDRPRSGKRHLHAVPERRAAGSSPT